MSWACVGILVAAGWGGFMAGHWLGWRRGERYARAEGRKRAAIVQAGG